MTLDTAFHHTKLHKQFRMKIVDYITKSRSESFCAKHRDWRPTRSRDRQLGEAQKDLLLWTIYTILSSSRSQKKSDMNLQFSNFKTPVIIPNCLVAILLVGTWRFNNKVY
jgi:hypothetical protein